MRMHCFEASEVLKISLTTQILYYRKQISMITNYLIYFSSQSRTSVGSANPLHVGSSTEWRDWSESSAAPTSRCQRLEMNDWQRWESSTLSRNSPELSVSYYLKYKILTCSYFLVISMMITCTSIWWWQLWRLFKLFYMN